MTLTVQEAFDKINAINLAIRFISDHRDDPAINEHEVDTCNEMIDLYKEYRSIIERAKVTI